jgi:hypothetical protein
VGVSPAVARSDTENAENKMPRTPGHSLRILRASVHSKEGKVQGGDTFTILTYGSRSGDFATLNIPAGGVWDPNAGTRTPGQ